MEFKAPKEDLKTVWLGPGTILGVGLNSTTGVTLYHKSFDYKKFYNCIHLHEMLEKQFKIHEFSNKFKSFLSRLKTTTYSYCFVFLRFMDFTTLDSIGLCAL